MEKKNDSKIILITGATSGIGKAAAIALARQGHHIIIHGRDAAKTEMVREEIIKTYGKASTDTLVSDLCSLKEVQKMADTFNKKYDRLDVLINNAGSLMDNNRALTPEGNEKTMAVNLLSPFLLTGLLLNKLKNSESARIINVASSAHKNNAKPDFSNPQNEANYTPLRTYGEAKLFLILVSQKLVRKLKMAGIKNITVNTLHPGAIASNFSVESDLGLVMKYVGKIARLFFRNAEKGAGTTVYLASSPEVENISGKYFIDYKPASIGQKYNSIENEDTIWTYCEQETGITVL